MWLAEVLVTATLEPGLRNSDPTPKVHGFSGRAYSGPIQTDRRHLFLVPSGRRRPTLRSPVLATKPAAPIFLGVLFWGCERHGSWVQNTEIPGLKYPLTTLASAR